MNLQTIQNYIAAGHNVNAARLTAEDARGVVVYTVGNAYLICIADQARITAVQAELATAKVTLDQAVASHDAGVSPRIDVLRAQVDYQNEQQTLISATNQLDKDKISLARTIGLPLAQAFRVVTDVPYAPLNDVDAGQAFQQALKTRKNLASLEEEGSRGRGVEEGRRGEPVSVGGHQWRLWRHRLHGGALARHLYRDRRGARPYSADRADPRA